MNLYKRLSWLCVYSLGSLLLISCLNSHSQASPQEQEGNFLLHHISDAHEWHFATIGKTHITLPLPVILFSKERGIEVFSSHHFWDNHHQKTDYRGYMLDAHDKIVSFDPQHIFYDLSITKNVASMLVSMAILVVITLYAAKRYSFNNSSVPRGFWGFFELIICFIRDEVAIPNIGKQQYMRFMPYLLSVFFFIWLNNLMGLLPGAANVTGNISVTLVLATFTFLMTTLHGSGAYWGHIFNPPGIPKWLIPIMVPVEILGVLTKPFSLMIRLFANITAGHIILLSIIGLIFTFQTSLVGIISVPFGGFMFLLKLLVAFLQAYIFTLLTAIYLGMAVEEHDH
eukprot:gene1063-1348_t